jgi:sodium-dependent dicarboxylate transporter 2/3/5
VAIEETGAAQWVANHFMQVISVLGVNSGIGLLGAVSILTILVSSFISRAPALGILTPIVLTMARESGTSVLAMGFITAISSAFTYMTVIGSPPNTIIFSSGYLQTRDYLRAGIWLTLASLIVLLLFAETYWRLVLPS